MSPIPAPWAVDPWVLTFTGRKVNVWQPDPATISLADVAHHLARTGRFSGAGDHFLSVAQHSVHVSLLCPPDRARWALLHDAEEAYLVDWPSPVKLILRALGGQLYIDWLGRWKLAISRAFGVPILDVKPWDTISMLTERRDNGPHGMPDADWLGAGGYSPADCPRPHPMRVLPLSPEAAESVYLNRWDQLWL